MNKELMKLALRRERLVLETAKQRVQLAQAVDVWRAPLSLADQGLIVISFIKQHPILMAGGSAVLMKLVGKSYIGKWIGRGMLAWQFMRKLQGKFLT